MISDMGKNLDQYPDPAWQVVQATPEELEFFEIAKIPEVSRVSKK